MQVVLSSIVHIHRPARRDGVAVRSNEKRKKHNKTIPVCPSILVPREERKRAVLAYWRYVVLVAGYTNTSISGPGHTRDVAPRCTMGGVVCLPLPLPVHRPPCRQETDVDAR